jgi:site-specific DNA-methyltransferase (adenine-specific)
VSALVRNRVLVGDVRKRLADLPGDSVDCVITSPPYYQLRDYGVTDQIGLEPTVQGWVDELRLVLAGLVRVLKATGSLWLNVGDTYSRHEQFGAPRKSLLLGPEKLLLALAEDGWIVRNKIVWAKTKRMPNSVRDRLSNVHEVVYFLTRSPHYYFDLDAIRVPHTSIASSRRGGLYPPARDSAPLWRAKRGGNSGLAALKARGQVGHPLGKNPGDVWEIATSTFSGPHFATFPPKLVERPLLATCPELICDTCGTPFRKARKPDRTAPERDRRPQRRPRRTPVDLRRDQPTPHCGPLLPACKCAGSVHPGVVLDPFFGAGTVGLVAEQHGRDWIGIELNPRYATLAEQRLTDARARRGANGPPVDGTADAVVSTDKPSNPERGNEP